MTKRIGILTTGGDSPGINAAIRAIGKALDNEPRVQLVGFQDGFSGMLQESVVEMESRMFSGILTTGGTILGTNRDQPNKMLIDGKEVDRTIDIVAAYHKYGLDGLICLGGSDAQDSAAHLMHQGLNLISLPITIDNDIPYTDTTVGFNTALEIASEAIDRLHSTAISRHRIIIVEVMGRESGWLTLGAGIAGGADVIIIPEIPYHIEKISATILDRVSHKKRFSLIAISDGAISSENVKFFEAAHKASLRNRTDEEEAEVSARLDKIAKRAAGDTLHLANRLENFTGLETRVTILGYLQRGGAPSAADRVLGTQLGTACAILVQQGIFGVMVGAHSGGVEPVPLDKVAGLVKTVPADHDWIRGARLVGTSLGD
ncbi:MAG: 6-phosphofructokinase [Bellilinea sp.]